ncbi:MAG: hypothetical protein ABIR67_03160 [Gaiellaceae bacterium]
MAADRPSPWRLDKLPPPSRADPQALSKAWSELLEDAPRPLRLSVGAWPRELRTPAWLLQELSRPAVGLDGVFLEAPQRQRPGWSWPLQIAILDGGRSALREQLTVSPPWLMAQLGLAELVEAESPEPCDLLVVPLRLRAAVARTLPLPVKASAVVLLDRMDEPWRRTHALLDTLLMDVEAGVVAFAPVKGKPAEWLVAVLESLAHDDGLDVALLRAARALELPAPVLVAERALLEETRMSCVRDRMTTRLRVGMAMANGGGPALMPMAEAAEAAPSFEHESRGASVLADISREARSLLPPAQPRFLQAQVLEHPDGGEATPARRLQPSSLHEVVVRVGPLDAAWLAGTAAFPDEELPPGEEHRLTVVLTEPYLLAEPQTAEILLPPAGPSTPCSFWLRAPAESGPVEARVIVLHEGRVLQTALLVGEITAGEVGDERALRLELEALVHPASDLAGRTRFDAAFVVNHDREDVPRVTLVAGEHVDIVEPKNIQEALEKIRTRLEDVVAADQIGGLDGEEIRTLLVFLAKHGSLLYEAVLDLQGAPLVGTERIQVVSVQPEAFLPLEFVYDRTPPSGSAKLCPNAKRALATGRCDDCPSLSESAFVCPLGFWCLSKVIERQLHKRNGVQGVQGDYRIQSAPTSTRARLGELSSALFAASKRVDDFREGTIAEVAEHLESATGVPASRAKTWPEWAGFVKQSGPGVLVVLPHTVNDEFDLSVLEIEEGEQLGVADIDDTYVGEQGPIVILLGCETGDPLIPFQEFPAAFRRSGASIVLATLTKVLGRNAGPVAARLVTVLAESSRSREVTFGEAMRDVRRALLAEGMPTVLAVTAYGDADWILGPTNGG